MAIVILIMLVIVAGIVATRFLYEVMLTVEWDMAWVWDLKRRLRPRVVWLEEVEEGMA